MDFTTAVATVLIAVAGIAGTVTVTMAVLSNRRFPMSKESKIFKVGKVEDVQLIDEANSMLKLGWILLNTYKAAVQSDAGPTENLHYVLGLPVGADD